MPTSCITVRRSSKDEVYSSEGCSMRLARH